MQALDKRMNKNFWARTGWVWLLAFVWAAAFGYHCYSTYTWHELSLGIPLVALIAAGWMLVFRKSKLWARLCVAALALALSATVGIFGARALQATRTFRHYQADSVCKIELFSIEVAPNTKEKIKHVSQFSLDEVAEDHRDRIRRIVATFQSLSPCWSGASRASGNYLVVLTDRATKVSKPIVIKCDPLTNPRTARVFVPWKAPYTGETMFSEYESAELYEELRRAGMR
jgi:hypothetical protein